MMMRLFLAAMLLVAAPLSAMQGPPHVPPPVGPIDRVEIDATKGRKIPLIVAQAVNPKGVILFGHGLGGKPEAYADLLIAWNRAGYTVVAPTSPDSLANPLHKGLDLPTGFGLRVEDLMTVRGYAFARFKGQKVVLAGHSYGSLFALVGAGAVTPAGALPGPPVTAVITFSSPGKIPGVVSDTTFASVKVPLLMITGDKDVVPGFVPDAKAHRLPFDKSAAGDKMLLSFTGGGHNIAAETSAAPWPVALRTSIDFLDAYVAGDKRAKARLDAAQSTPAYTIERR